MSATADYLAIDLGASAGRAILGQFDGEQLALEEMHRFDNGAVSIGDALYWDAFRLFGEIKHGLSCCTQRGLKLCALGIDTWGVDCALFAAGGELLSMPRHYRDPRNTAMMHRACEMIGREEIYRRTGIQFLPFNTLYQLMATASSPARLLDLAVLMLFMPDLFACWLTGSNVTEPCIASTSQVINAQTGGWDVELLGRLGIPDRIMPAILECGSVAGHLMPAIAAEVGQDGTPVILTASHDTAAAVVAVPARQAHWAYISSGTWSLIGVELHDPIITQDALSGGFTNEVGIGGTTRFLRNVAGLWLLQECRRTWASQGTTFSHAELLQLAEQAPALVSLIDPDDPRFSAPGDMPERIAALCREGGQRAPQSPGETVRCILESLALKYAHVLTVLERILGHGIEVLHIVGGGVQNDLLNQFTADATGRLVLAGPVEATATGNIMVQVMARQQVASIEEIRQVVTASFRIKRFEPRSNGGWDEARERFTALIG